MPEEAELLREAAGQVLAGSSLRSIAAEWNGRGLVTTTGASWTSSNLGRTLRGPHLAGCRVHRVKNPDGKMVRQVTAAAWPAIFSPDEHERIVMAAGEHREAKVSRHMLTGFARCGACGGNLRGKTTRRFGFQYQCHACTRVTIKAEPLEALLQRPCSSGSTATIFAPPWPSPRTPRRR